MTVVFLSGAGAALLAFLSPGAGAVAGFPAHCILKAYRFLADFFLKLPGALFLTGKPENWQILLYYLLLAVLLFFMKLYGKRKKEKKEGVSQKKPAVSFPTALLKAGVFACCLLLPCLLCYSGKQGLTITMLDVGQGDGLYMKLPKGQSLFVDGGSSSVKQLGAYRILPFLKSVRENRVDVWIISHGDSDHYSGFLEILDEVEKGNYAIGELWLPQTQNPGEGYKTLESRAKALSIPVKKIHSGMVYQTDGLTMTCLNPEAEYESESENAYSSVFLLEYGAFSGLLTGDVEKGGEDQVKEELEKKGIKQLTFLKVAHHGSANSTTEAFSRGLSLRLAFVSAGKDNSYGHPSGEVVKRLQEMGAKLYSTVESGAVTLFTNGKTLSVQTFRK
jgi:competence protein ComEC